MSNFFSILLRRLVLIGLVVLALVASNSATPDSAVQAQESETAGPTFTITKHTNSFRPDKPAFGLLLEPTRQVTGDSQFFYRSPEGLARLKQLGVKTIVYVTDGNNWRALYDDISGEPQPYPKGIEPLEALNIAQAIGASIVPAVNITAQCTSTGPPYISANMTCQHAKPKDAVALVKLLKKEAAARNVPFKEVILGGEPYAGCQYWRSPAGVNCTVANPVGRHRIGLPAEEYVKRIKKWTTAIRKVDANLKFGAHIQTNTFYCKTSCDRPWSQVILQDAGHYIDFVVLHQYFRVPLPLPVTELDAQKYSYYQNQVDIIKRKKGKTGMPKQARAEIVKWAPVNKKSMPMWYSEFNASSLDIFDDQDAGGGRNTPGNDEFAAARGSLYGGLALGEVYLDMLSPIGKGVNAKAGASRSFFHHLFAHTTFLASFQPIESQDQTMVMTPGWHILSSLKSFANKEWLFVKGKAIPQNATGRASVKTYAAREGKKVTIALFNHETTQTITVDLKLNNMPVKKVKVTRVGEAADSILDQNNYTQPNHILPHTSTLANSHIKKWGLSQVPLAPHSLTVLEVTLK